MATKEPAASSAKARAGAKVPAEAQAPAVATASETTPPAATQTTADAASEQEVVFVDAPVPPTKRGNRVVGSLIAVLATAVFAALYALVSYAYFAFSSQGSPAVGTEYLVTPVFYFHVTLFLIAMVIEVLIINRAGWWAHIFGSVAVGVFVYLGSIGALLLLGGVVSETPEIAQAAFAHGLIDARMIAAALVAREVAIWTGAVISWRGKKVKVRNVAAREAFEAEQAELTGK
jgi:hypothetical protein